MGNHGVSENSKRAELMDRTGHHGRLIASYCRVMDRYLAF